MARKATLEYVGAKRRACALLTTKAARSAALDEFCTFTGASRKYANKLLTLRDSINPIRLLGDTRRKHSLILRKQGKIAVAGRVEPSHNPLPPPSFGVQYLTD